MGKYRYEQPAAAGLPVEDDAQPSLPVPESPGGEEAHVVARRKSLLLVLQCLRSAFDSLSLPTPAAGAPAAAFWRARDTGAANGAQSMVASAWGRLRRVLDGTARVPLYGHITQKGALRVHASCTLLHINYCIYI